MNRQIQTWETIISLRKDPMGVMLHPCSIRASHTGVGPALPYQVGHRRVCHRSSQVLVLLFQLFHLCRLCDLFSHRPPAAIKFFWSSNPVRPRSRSPGHAYHRFVLPRLLPIEIKAHGATIRSLESPTAIFRNTPPGLGSRQLATRAPLPEISHPFLFS